MRPGCQRLVPPTARTRPAARTVELAQAAEASAATAGFAQYTREQQQAQARQEQIGAAAAQYEETVNDIDLLRGEQQTLSQADTDYIAAKAGDDVTYADASALSRTVDTPAILTCLTMSCDGACLGQRLAAAGPLFYTYSVDQADANDTYAHATTADKTVQAATDSGAMDTYQVGYHGAEKSYDDTMSGLLQSYDVATTTADADYSAAAGATTGYDQLAAGYACDYATTVAADQAGYSTAVAGFGATRADADAAAYEGGATMPPKSPRLRKNRSRWPSLGTTSSRSRPGRRAVRFALERRTGAACHGRTGQRRRRGGRRTADAQAVAGDGPDADPQRDLGGAIGRRRPCAGCQDPGHDDRRAQLTQVEQMVNASGNPGRPDGGPGDHRPRRERLRGRPDLRERRFRPKPKRLRRG